MALDERSIYILFGGDWGSRARVTWKDRVQRHRIVVESVSTKPLLICLVIRADRYKTYFRMRTNGGAATINFFPFFDSSLYADDLVETYIETLRKDANHPAKELRSIDASIIFVTAEEMEVNLLSTWQMLCGVCNRLDLIDGATTKNWRSRFHKLDQWFQKNRPYIFWDNNGSRLQVDENAKEEGRPTRRSSRFIPELKPPWLSGDVLKGSTTPKGREPG